MAYIGAHLSSAGGTWRAIERAYESECEALQLFTRNQLQWKSSSITLEESERFHRCFMSSGLKTIISHASYLINLSGAQGVREKSVEALIEEIGRCHCLGIESVVVHPGFYGEGSSVNEGIERVADSLKHIIERTDETRVDILLETMAGQGTVLGSRIEELEQILSLLGGHARLNFCVDFCHLFAAGYDLRSQEAYSSFFMQFERQLGLKRIRCFHLSDCKQGLGDKKDRHEHIGEGKIGCTPFALLMADKRFDSIPAILETPKTGMGDRGNLNLLRKFRSY